MKKNILILCMLGASALTANGQTLLKGTKFTDNWSFGINVRGEKRCVSKFGRSENI